MEQHGLEQVIAELKARGVQAGEAEALRLVAEAKVEAKRLIAEARAEADHQRQKAEQDKAQTLVALRKELALAANVGLLAFRESIERGFVAAELDAAVKAALDKPAVVEEAILELVRAFAAAGMGKAEVELLLPVARQNDLGQTLLGALAARGQKGVQLSFDESLRFGFKIGPKGGGFTFDLSDESFKELFVRFVAPRFREAFYAQPVPEARP